MRKLHFVFAALGALFLSVSAHAEKLRVVATLPDLAALAQQLGGDHVQVESLARASEDPHFVDARPSFVRLLNQADVLIEGGAGLEAGWLEPLVQNARNPTIQTGKSGRVVASAGLTLLDVPASLDRSQGDVHPQGNPHYMLDPEAVSKVAATIAAGLSQVDAAHAHDYAAELRKFQEQLNGAKSKWIEQFSACKGARVVAYHKSFDYLLKRYGLELAGTIEPKPGIEPSPAHIAHLVRDAKAAGVKVVIAESFRPQKTAERVASETGAQYVALPLLAGADDSAKDYFSWMNLVVSRLSEACGRTAK
ncbi:MAG TPA: metal ABC transporter substrate-binding protein [Methylomirabilota bacterium]|nr:metal ABC transporter substrate-binding protein [Methylomirabilota bacterium]